MPPISRRLLRQDAVPFHPVNLCHQHGKGSASALNFSCQSCWWGYANDGEFREELRNERPMMSWWLSHNLTASDDWLSGNIAIAYRDRCWEVIFNFNSSHCLEHSPFKIQNKLPFNWE